MARLYTRRPIEERFWEKVDKRGTDECWLWVAATANGYGALGTERGRRPTYAHRFSWQLHNGPIPDGMWVLHDCPGGDNRACVNPRHLWLGDNDANHRDMWAKGRGFHARYRGEEHGSAKITEAHALEIRRRYAAGGVSMRRLGLEYGLKENGVRNIITRRTWKHLP